jgi:hypothetical protein
MNEPSGYLAPRFSTKTLSGAPFQQVFQKPQPRVAAPIKTSATIKYDATAAKRVNHASGKLTTITCGLLLISTSVFVQNPHTKTASRGGAFAIFARLDRTVH